MSLELVPLKETHWLELGPNASIKGDFYDRAWRLRWVEPGLSWALLDDGRAVALGGVMTRLPGVGYCWAAISVDIGVRRLRKIAACCKQEIDVLMGGRFNRLEAVVHRNYDKGVQFAKLLGFEVEGLARKWDGEQDYFVFARVV